MSDANSALVARFASLPTETQQCVLSSLHSRTHLHALSLCSAHLHSLTSEHLFREISFDPLSSDESVLSYLLHCAPVHGHCCRCLTLGFSLGPMVSRAADLLRAQLFVRILQCTKGGLRKLEIDVAGTDLRNTMPLFKAIAEMNLEHLECLRLKIHDVEEDEVPTLKRIFRACRNNASAFPALREVSIEGHWELNHSGRMASTFRALKGWLSTLPRLAHLNLSYLTIPKSTLSSLLADLNMSRLTLNEMEPLSWQDCVEAASTLPSLRWLSITLADTNMSERKINANLVMPALGRLDLSLTRYAPSTSGTDSILRLYQGALDRRDHVFPRLQVLGVGTAIQELAMPESRTALHLLLGMMAASGPTDVVLANSRSTVTKEQHLAVREAGAFLTEQGIIPRFSNGAARAEDESAESMWSVYPAGKVLWINKDLRNGRIDLDRAAEADAAAEALARQHGAILL